MEKPREDIIELIRKCLALSGSSNEYEAALALSKAQELLEKYNLSMREVKDIPQGSWDLLDYDLPFEKKLQDWKIRLFNHIAKANLCYLLTEGPRIHILGLSWNISAVLEMALWVINQLEMYASFKTMSYSGPDPKLAYRNSFIWSAVSEIQKRLNESQTSRMDSDINTRALIIDSKEQLMLFVNEKYPERSFTGKYHSNTSLDGHRDGIVTGRSIGLVGPSRQTYGPQLKGGD